MGCYGRKFLFLLLFAPALQAQSTNVSGTITDAGGQSWNNGTYSFFFVPAPINPQGPYRWNGAPFNTSQIISGNLDGTGSFTGAMVPSNTAITPSGTKWIFQACPASTTSCNQVTLTITGATQSVTASIIPPAITLNLSNPLPGAAAYSDSEIVGARQGSMYFNLTDNSLHMCGGFPVCIWIVGGGGAPPPSGVTSVGLALPLEYSVTGSPVTTSGTLTGAWLPEIPNTVFAGPGLNAAGGVFDGRTTNLGSGTSVPLTPINPTTAHDWAFVMVQAQTLTQSSPPTMPVSWTRNFNNGNAAGVFNKVFNTNATISDTATLANSASWINALAILRLQAGVPIIVQQTSASGASAFTTLPFGSNLTSGSSILAVHCGVPPSSGTATGSFSDSAGDGYTLINYIQQGSAEVCNVGLSANVTGGSAPTVTFTPSLTSGSYSNSFSLAMELSNLQPNNGQPGFRALVTADLPATVGTVSNITVGNFSPLFSTNVTNPTTTPAVTFSPISASVNTVYAGPTSGGSANPTFRSMVAADLPATTSNCVAANNSFAVGLNAGGTPICGTAGNVQAVQVFSATTLGGDLAVAATTQTDVMTRTVTMPSSGCPCRVFLSYSLYVNTASSGVGYSFWVNDGSVNMAGVNTGQSNASSGALTSATYGGWTTVTYTNSTAVTFTLRTEGDHTYTVKAAPSIGSAPNSSFQVSVSTSN